MTFHSWLADDLCALEEEWHLQFEIFLQKYTHRFTVLQVRMHLLSRYNAVQRQLGQTGYRRDILDVQRKISQ